MSKYIQTLYKPLRAVFTFQSINTLKLKFNPIRSPPSEFKLYNYLRERVIISQKIHICGSCIKIQNCLHLMYYKLYTRFYPTNKGLCGYCYYYYLICIQIVVQMYTKCNLTAVCSPRLLILLLMYTKCCFIGSTAYYFLIFKLYCHTLCIQSVTLLHML